MGARFVNHFEEIFAEYADKNLAQGVSDFSSLSKNMLPIALHRSAPRVAKSIVSVEEIGGMDCVLSA